MKNKKRSFPVLAVILCSVLLPALGFALTGRSGTTGGEIPTAERSFGEPAIKLSGLVSENTRGESVFAVSPEDFISCFNGVYRQKYEKDFFHAISSENWLSFPELSPCLGHDCIRFVFSADRDIQPMPTVSLYASDDEIHELRMTFDDHGYQECFYRQFRELCLCMEKLLLPELSDAERESLFEALYAGAYENFFGDHYAYGDAERPPLKGLIRCGCIGIYSFYGSGNIEICFVPLADTEGDLLRSHIENYDFGEKHGKNYVAPHL